MTLDITKFNATVESAKAAAATSPAWLRAIERASEGIQSGELIVTTLQDGALVTSPNGSYMANGACQCRAYKKGHKECRHRAAARLMERYEEEAANPAVSPTDERAAIIADIKNRWPRFAPYLPLASELMARFGKSKLEMLDDESLRRVRLAISM
jgi:hypothetical protein